MITNNVTERATGKRYISVKLSEDSKLDIIWKPPIGNSIRLNNPNSAIVISDSMESMLISLKQFKNNFLLTDGLIIYNLV